MRAQIFGDTILARVGLVPVTATMVASAATSLLLVIVSWFLARAVVRDPHGRPAAAGRLVAGFLRDLVTEAVGRPAPAVEVFAGSLFLFIAGAAVLGQLPGVPTATANLPATAALAVLVFLAVPVAGIRIRGVGGYFRHYFEPTPLLFPINLVSEISRTLALALRLFGNMMSGQLVVALLVALAGFIVPVPLMALHLFIGLLQAYIFTILASVYIGAAIRVGEEAR